MVFVGKHRPKVEKKLKAQGKKGRDLFSATGKELGKMYRAQKKTYKMKNKDLQPIGPPPIGLHPKATPPQSLSDFVIQDVGGAGDNLLYLIIIHKDEILGELRNLYGKELKELYKKIRGLLSKDTYSSDEEKNIQIEFVFKEVMRDFLNEELEKLLKKSEKYSLNKDEQKKLTELQRYFNIRRSTLHRQYENY